MIDKNLLQVCRKHGGKTEIKEKNLPPEVYCYVNSLDKFESIIKDETWREGTVDLTVAWEDAAYVLVYKRTDDYPKPLSELVFMFAHRDHLLTGRAAVKEMLFLGES